MKILNDIACSLNWIELKRNGMKNWWKRYLKYTHEYDVNFFKNLNKYLKRHHPCLFTCEWTKQTPI